LATRSTSDGPMLAPPLYGRWYAGATAADARHADHWFETLNLDPKYRPFAGAGVRVIEQQQERWLAEAWEQLGEAQRASRLLHHALLGRGAFGTVAKRLAALPPDSQLTVTAPLHWRTRLDEVRDDRSARRTVTLADSLSRVAPDPLSAAFRRITRPRGPLAR